MIKFAIVDVQDAERGRLEEIDGCRLSEREVCARLPRALILEADELARRWNAGRLDCGNTKAAAFDAAGADRMDAPGLLGDGELDDGAVIRLAILWFADDIARRIGDEHDFEEWPEWMFARHIPGECPHPLPSIMELYLENDPAICAEFRTRVQARVRRLQSKHARP